MSVMKFVTVLQLVLAAVLMCVWPSAAAPSLSPEKCTVTRQPNGSIRYKLLEPPDASCTTEWEDINKTAIAHDSVFDKKVVLALNNQSLDLRQCKDYMQHFRLCSGVGRKTLCTVNCSSLLGQEHPPVTVNSTVICFTTWCVNKDKFIGFTTFVFFLLVAILGVWFVWTKCRKNRDQTEYEPTYVVKTEQIII